MPLVSPDEIAAKAANAYPRFLKQWIRGEEADFFPYRVRVRLAIDPRDMAATIAASDKLLAGSKATRGWGYTVHREQVRSRDFGNNLVPKSITIDTLDDLLRLTQQRDDFAATRRVVERIRADLPQLEEWLTAHARSLGRLAGALDGLVSVAQFFLNKPWPDCYARQIPIPVDTKFIDRYQTTLRQWLDLLLPASAIDVNESKFVRRFGLKDGQPHRALRLLDSQLLHELGLPVDELSLPLDTIATLPVRDATAFIVENDLNLLTLPPFPRGIGLRGEGNAVNRMERLGWLNENRIVYWGDIDVDGFLILSRLRNFFPHVESVLMDRETMECHDEFIVDGNSSAPALPTNLTPEEVAVFAFCSKHNRRLEQEKILQSFVDHALADLNGRAEQ